MNLFYADPGEVQEHSLAVRGQEAEHIIKVLRHSVGDNLSVTDGNGKCYRCRIRNFQKRMVYLDILNVEEIPEYEPKVMLCMGIIKKRDRLEFAVEKAVELGVFKIVLYKGDHSEKGNVREDRLASTAISAMKQSLRFYLPEIYVEDSLQDALSAHAKNTSVIIADETHEGTNEKLLAAQSYFLVVGPEGGFSKGERKYFQSLNPQFYSLGEQRLRAETAAIVMADRFANMK